ncbi:helix-turn-helix domain-containing protein [Extensimonas perlucida]|uniref:helix-turn-helix domain-containing protein n=1 Tax=Extensimonas perlucida TaxID=2590786 RepID=UPI0011A27882|nr:helix-turn-helix domain-containing protein [Extensimonas perlucida]
MSDSPLTPAGTAQDASNKEADAVRAGALLRAAREAAGVHIATLAGTLKVPLDKLQALENGDLAALPDMVFARALASSVCRSLKIDPAPVLALLPRVAPGSLAGQTEGINTPVKNLAGKSLDFSPAHGKHRWLGWLVLALLLGALALIFWPHGAPDRSTEGLKPAGAGASAATAQQQPELQTPWTPSSTPGPAAVQMELAQTPASASGAAAASALAGEGLRPAGSASPTAAIPGGAAAAAALAPSAAASAAAEPVRVAPAAGAELLLLRARSASWVQVRDAAGKVVLERTLQAGESAPVAGTLPLAVVLGRADAVEVFVRGQPFVPPAVSKGNVSRFEVK